MYQKDNRNLSRTTALATTLLLAACGGSSGSGSSDSGGNTPGNGQIGGGNGSGGQAPSPVAPSQPENDTTAPVLAGQVRSFATYINNAPGSQKSVDFEGGYLLAAYGSNNRLLLLDLNNPDAVAEMADAPFAVEEGGLIIPGFPQRSGLVTAFDEDDDDEEEEDEDEEDDDDYGNPGNNIVVANELSQAMIGDGSSVWAVVPYIPATELDTALGRTRSTEYGVYTGSRAALSTGAVDVSGGFTVAISGEAPATGYVKELRRAHNGTVIGLQVYDDETTGAHEVRFVKLNNAAAITEQSAVLPINIREEILRWDVNEGGSAIALVTRHRDSQIQTLHLFTGSSMGALLQSPRLLPFSAMGLGNNTAVTDIAFFGSDKRIAVSAGNQVSVATLENDGLSPQDIMTYNSDVAALESDFDRGFLVVKHGDELQFLASENHQTEVAKLTVPAALNGVIMDDQSILLYSASEFQVVEY